VSVSPMFIFTAYETASRVISLRDEPTAVKHDHRIRSRLARSE